MPSGVVGGSWSEEWLESVAMLWHFAGEPVWQFADASGLLSK